MNFRSTLSLLFLCFIICQTCIGQNDGQKQDGSIYLKYWIPKKQKIYTSKTSNTKGLEPYEKITLEIIGKDTIKTIEKGDYVVKEEYKNKKRERAKSDFTIYSQKIIGNDTTFSFVKKEIKKENKIRLAVSLNKKDSRLNLKLERGISKSTDNLKNSKDYINSSDNETSFFFKLEPGEEFKYRSSSLALGGVSLPFKIRLKSTVDTLKNTVETGLNNIGVYLGYRLGFHKYKNGKFRNLNVILAPYLGPSAIKLKNSNTGVEIKDEVTKLGLTYGVAFLVKINKVNIGLAIGKDNIFGSKNESWIYEQKPYLGFVVGYNSNLLNN